MICEYCKTLERRAKELEAETEALKKSLLWSIAERDNLKYRVICAAKGA